MPPTWLKRNLKALKTRFPTAYHQVMTAPDTVTLQGKQLSHAVNGTTHIFPPLEAISHAVSTASTILDPGCSLVVYSGCGAGYVPRAIANVMPKDTHLLIQERRPEVFKGMLTAFDCRALLTHPRVDVAVGPVNLPGLVQQHLVRHGHAVQVAHDQEQWALCPEYASTINDELMPFLQDFQVNFNTMTHFGAIFTENCIKQLPAYLTSFGVDVLADQFAGFPAVVIGGGPSLNRNVEVVRGFKGKGVIICADTVLGYLLKRGISPDFVMSVDPQDRTFEKYKDLTIPDEVALVYHPGNRHEISTTWPRDKYHTGTAMHPYGWADPFLGRRTPIDGNIHCQVHYGCNLAVHMGCKPIALVGLDLAFTDALYHAKGASYLGEQEEADHVAAGLDVTDIFGQPVKTIPIFLNYRHILETKAKEQPNRYVYATEGGIGVPGIPNVPLANVLASLGTGRYVSVAERRRWCHQMAAGISKDALIEEGWRRTYELQNATILALKIRTLLDGHVEAVDTSRRLSRLMKALQDHIAALGLLHLIGAESEQTYMHQVVDNLDRIPDPKERYDLQCHRARLFVAPIIAHAGTVSTWLAETLSTLGPTLTIHQFKRMKKGLL